MTWGSLIGRGRGHVSDIIQILQSDWPAQVTGFLLRSQTQKIMKIMHSINCNYSYHPIISSKILNNLYATLKFISGMISGGGYYTYHTFGKLL
jgi:hypothetical protein